MEFTCKPTSVDKTFMGTRAWGRRKRPLTHGRLTGLEKAVLLGNLGRMAVLELGDTLSSHLGTLEPRDASLEALQPPRTRLVEDALSFAMQVQSPEVLSHSWRTYYWGVLLGEYRKLDVDREILFAGSILHDVGIATGREKEPCSCCFVVYGAERAAHQLVSKGHDPARVRQIGDAIGLHLNGYVSNRLHGAEAHLLCRGAMCDVFGFGKRRIGPAIKAGVSTDHPRGNLRDALEIWPDHHLEGTRAEFLISLKTARRRRKPREVRPAHVR
ncbi:HD domain-containing protein [Roseibium sp.]|uniref:HD domain-containing protein n=1 Tax=Roseibium sp. TaxID=1936156 RepID=UPI003A96A0A9